MSYTLGNITLPNPKRVTREFIETGVRNLLIEGISTQKIENRKERFILEFQHLTPSEVNSIVSEYELNTVRDFTVDDTNMSVSATRVLIDITNRSYPLSGDLYREDLTLVLSEII